MMIMKYTADAKRCKETRNKLTSVHVMHSRTCFVGVMTLEFVNGVNTNGIN